MHHPTPVFRDPGLFHLWLWVPRRVGFFSWILLFPPANGEGEKGEKEDGS